MDISIIIPAYNEASRISPTIRSVSHFFTELGLEFEIIVVDDGSTDNTVSVIEKLQKGIPQLSCLSLGKNFGKGKAVREGILKGQGKQRLFLDADGSTPVEEYLRLLPHLSKSSPLVMGSRAILSNETIVETSIKRKVIGRCFNLLVNILIDPKVKDTQCGFKLLMGDTCEEIFPKMKLDGFAFDCELLRLIKKAGLKYKEVPVNWHNVSGSKVFMLTDPLKMFLDLVRIRLIHI